MTVRKRVGNPPPGIIERIVQQLRAKLTRKKREQIVRQMRARLTNHNFTIFSDNCVGGVVQHDLGVRFHTPTINVGFHAEDYLKLLENPRYYFAQPISVIHPEEYPFPLAKLGDLTLYLNHCAHDFNSDEEFVKKWNERTRRINWDNIFVMSTDRDGMTPELMARFDKIPYKKVMFVHKPAPYDWAIYLPQFRKKPIVGLIMRIANLKGERYYETGFDLVEWLNTGSICGTPQVR